MKISKNECVVLREIHSTYFLINTKAKYCENNRSVIELNEMGKVIWELLDTVATPDKLLKQISNLYGISTSDFETVKADINLFLNRLQSLGYVNYE